MYSAQEYYEKAQEKYQKILTKQILECEEQIAKLLQNNDYMEFYKGHFAVDLDEKPLPELLLKLSNLGYCNICYNYDRLYKNYTVSFDVPHLVHFGLDTEGFN